MLKCPRITPTGTQLFYLSIISSFRFCSLYLIGVFFSFRKHTEQIVSARAALVKSVADVAELETKINGGQIEEVVIQAENELNLSRKILEWKSWEPLIAEAPANQWKWPI